MSYLLYNVLLPTLEIAALILLWVAISAVWQYFHRETPEQWNTRYKEYRKWYVQQRLEIDRKAAAEGFASRLDYWKSKL